MKWEVMDSRIVLDSPWLEVEKHTVKLPAGKVIDDYYVVNRKPYVIIIPVEEDNVYFIKQYRHGIGKKTINLPMGLIDGSETIQDAAKRELLEETGFVAKNLRYLGKISLGPSNFNITGHIVLAKELKLRKNHKIDDSEGEITIMEINKERIKDLIEHEKIIDASTICALYFADMY